MLRILFYSFFAYVLSVVALAFLFVPFISVAPALQKGALVAGVLGLLLAAMGALLLFIRHRPAIAPPLLTATALPLFAVVVISAVAHQRPLLSFAGLGFEMGTVGAFGLFAATVSVAALLNRGHIRIVLQFFVALASVASAFAGISYAAGWEGAITAFSSWPQLSLLIAAAALIAAAHSDIESGPSRWWHTAAALFLGALLLLFYHATAAALLAACLAVFALCRVIVAVQGPVRWPVISSVMLVLFLLLLFSGFQSVLTLPPDVRLTQEATSLAGDSAYAKGLSGILFGSGTDTFSLVWEQSRPATFNQSPFWQTSFREGYSSVLTWLVTIGALGVLCLFLPLLWLLWSGARSYTLGGREVFSDTLFMSSAGLALFVFASASFYTIELPLFLLGAMALGFCARLLTVASPRLVERSVPARLFPALALLLVGALLLVVSVRQLTAASLHEKGVALFESGNIAGADTLLRRSVAVWPSPLYTRDASRVALESVRMQTQRPNPQKQLIQEDIAAARALARAAVERDTTDFSSHLSHGSILTALVIAGLKEVGPEAARELSAASALSPSRPDAFYLQAVLWNALGNKGKAAGFVSQALRLKGDYAPAVELSAQLRGE